MVLSRRNRAAGSLAPGGAVAGLALAMVAAWMAPVEAATAGELRMATLAPEGSSWMVVLERAAQRIARATDRRVSLRFLGGGQMGDEREVVRQMRLGKLEGAVVTGTGLSLIDESIRVLELPMLFADTRELDCVRRKVWPHFEKRFIERGFILGEPGDVGFIYLYSNHPVRSLSDLRKQRAWMWTDDRIVRAMFKKLRVRGVPLGVPDVREALVSGRLDAAYGSPLSTVALRWSAHLRYVTSMPMAYALGATVIRKDVYDRLDPRDRAAMDAILERTGERILGTIRRDNRQARRALTGLGIRTVATPAPLVAEFKRASREVASELAGKVYQRSQLDMVLSARTACRR